MTDEERQKLCANLRADAYALTDSFALHNRTAADEIERLAALVQFDVEPGLTERIVRALERRRFTDQHGRYLLTQTGAYEACREVLAQSDARLDAVVTTCPKCGKPVTSYWHKDNSGCESRPEYALIADAVFHAECLPYAQSDAEPPPKHPIGFDDKPMTDWYYDDEGVCRPSHAADRSGK